MLGKHGLRRPVMVGSEPPATLEPRRVRVRRTPKRDLQGLLSSKRCPYDIIYAVDETARVVVIIGQTEQSCWCRELERSALCRSL